ncbi:MAG: hypothetical protein IPM83_16970 [Ignavibacteria bacterium]|nr:hypothetical protein [Ignavibacteria bacterium]
MEERNAADLVLCRHRYVNAEHVVLRREQPVFLKLFVDAVQLTARRDVPMGICLSGGLDSTSIASVLASSTDEHSIKTFTAFLHRKGNVDERP